MYHVLLRPYVRVNQVCPAIKTVRVSYIVNKALLPSELIFIAFPKCTSKNGTIKSEIQLKRLYLHSCRWCKTMALLEVIHNKDGLVLAPKMHLLRGTGCTCVPDQLLQRIWQKYTLLHNLEHSINNESSIMDVEKGLKQAFGESVLDWEQKFVAAKICSEEDAREVLECFRPTLHKTVTWLGSDHIYETIRQYDCIEEYNYKTFPPFSVNLAFQLKTAPVAKRRFGFIINTAKGDGVHWVALFIDLDKGCTYFDSFGNDARDDMVECISTIITTMTELFPDVTTDLTKVSMTKIKRQRNGDSCGVYCAWFLSDMITRKRNLSDPSCSVYTDDNAHEIRKLLWNEI